MTVRTTQRVGQCTHEKNDVERPGTASGVFLEDTQKEPEARLPAWQPRASKCAARSGTYV